MSEHRLIKCLRSEMEYNHLVILILGISWGIAAFSESIVRFCAVVAGFVLPLLLIWGEVR
jgi:hypothetical protein